MFQENVNWNEKRYIYLIKFTRPPLKNTCT